MPDSIQKHGGENTTEQSQPDTDSIICEDEVPTQKDAVSDNEDRIDASQISNKSYIWSLDDDDFVELLNRLSQREKLAAVTNSQSKEEHISINGTQNSLIEDDDVDKNDHCSIGVNDHSGIDSSLTDESDVHEERSRILMDDLDPFLDNSLVPNPSELHLSGQTQLVGEDFNASEEQQFQSRQPDPPQFQIDTDPDKEPNIAFGDYNEYFATKGANQQKEDEDFLAWDDQRRQILSSSLKEGIDSNVAQDQDVYSDLLSKRSDILKGCVIHVNGYTKPGIHTLHKLIVLNGGKFMHHLSSKGSVTHIICSRLTPRKQVEFKNYKVCKPEWIVDSVNQGKLVHWSKYSIIEAGYGQAKLPFSEVEVDAIVPEDDTVLTNDEDHESDQDELNKLYNSQDDLEPEAAGEAIDSKHPNFLKTFFAKSRLHHLSNWKQDLRSTYLQLSLTQPKPTPKYQNPKDFKVIIHVDFDCFFAKASSLSHPEIDFSTQPVCVSHASGNKQTLANSSADISSCNYVCRAYGVKNGMWVRNAMKLCPELVCLGYDFDTYEEISGKFYEILMGLGADSVYPVSVDEALLDISSLFDQRGDYSRDTELFCQGLRAKIFKETKCQVSIGCSTNVLLAKLSLRKAKPNGFRQTFGNIEQFLDEFNVRDLPGFGHSNESKLIQHLKMEDVKVSDLRQLSIPQLEKLFGNKTALKLYNYARGVDTTSIDITANPKDFIRKSISIDINWGIRFDTASQVDKFLYDVAKEIHSKLAKLKLVTSNVTLKLLKRAKHAPVEPAKYLGCGECDTLSKSSKLAVPTNDFKILGTEARSLYRSIGCDPVELRGVGILVNKLIPEAGVVRQKTLKFKKIDFQAFNKIQTRPQESPNRNVQSTATKEPDSSLDMSLLDIPNDMNSSIIEELPPKMQDQILRQRNLNYQPVLEVPKEIDVAIFNQLPPDIQQEVKEELRRRNIKINQGESDKNYIYQKIFNAEGKIETVKVLKSPKKKPTSPKRQLSPVKLSSPSPLKKKVKLLDVNLKNIDEAVLNELPEDMRQAVIEEYKFYNQVANTKVSIFKKKEQDLVQLRGTTNTSNSDRTPLVSPLKFQKLTRPKQILSLISKWLESSILEDISSGDVRILDKYLDSLQVQNVAMHLLALERIRLFYLLKVNEGVIFDDHWLSLMRKYLG
ncbi:hypothetical protein WICPIJ_003663 [Wickerhamomyces pijperi]|uniref:DNA repair protein REV1 n=1 Tax=Wickerhamomyces pijperi TaxID=599730 RepID=A0A9P8Q783_WICPI|nr:hypothetical protein WICPIJ_003663 [Wickerhamomyces pijperi]